MKNQLYSGFLAGVFSVVYRKNFCIFLVMLIINSLSSAFGQNSYSGRVVDVETGKQAWCTISVWDNRGYDVQIDGQHEFVNYLGKKRWYIDGEFSITSANDSLYVEIRRGPETLPVNQVIHPSKVKGDVQQFSLRRWIDMARKGYLSGDTHVHFLELNSSFQQMQAEDLHVVNLLVSDFTNDVEKFTGALDKISTDDQFIYVGQEIRDWQLGHASLLDLKKIIQPLTPDGGRAHPNILLSPRLEESAQQNASNVWAHFSNLPGLESAIAFPLGLIDAVELMTYNDPTQLPSHITPWDYSKMSRVEFPELGGMDLYYQYLNAGFHIPIAAGTDKMDNNIPVGSNRLYVRIEGKTSYKNWIEGMKAGRGFISNGPMLTFSVDGHLTGDVVDFRGPKVVKVKIRAESMLPFGRLELVANGKLIAWKEVWDMEKNGDTYSAELETEIALDRSTWIAGRVTSVDQAQMLPRNLTVYAHTNPVYFLKDNQQVYFEESLDYLLKYLESGRNWIKNYSGFATEGEAKEAMGYLEKAEKVYQEIKTSDGVGK